MYKNTVALVLYLYLSCHVCSNVNDMTQLECYFARMHVSDGRQYDHSYHQLYSDSEIVIRLLGQIKVDATPLDQELQPDVKTVIYVDCICDICIHDIHSYWLLSLPDK